MYVYQLLNIKCTNKKWQVPTTKNRWVAWQNLHTVSYYSGNLILHLITIRLASPIVMNAKWHSVVGLAYKNLPYYHLVYAMLRIYFKNLIKYVFHNVLVDFVLVYFINIIIYSNMEYKHKKHLPTVLSHLWEHKMYSKCKNASLL